MTGSAYIVSSFGKYNFKLSFKTNKLIMIFITKITNKNEKKRPYLMILFKKTTLQKSA